MSKKSSEIKEGLIESSASPEKLQNANATVRTVSAILFYASVSLAIVFFNKWLFTKEFPFPVFVSWIQQAVGIFIFLLFAVLGKWISFLSHFPLFLPSFRTALRVVPLSIFFVLMVSAGNVCLKYVQISTYQVARSLTICFTIILSYLVLGQRQSCMVIASCFVMTAGFVIASLDPSTLCLLGGLTGAASSVFQAAYLVTIKTTLTHVDGNTNVMLFYNQLISSVIFFPVFCVSGEYAELKGILPINPLDPIFYKLWGLLAASALLSTLLGLASYLCVKMSSPLTFNIVGTTKSLAQSVGGVLFTHDVFTIQSISGVILSIAGSAWYSHIKFSQASKAEAEREQPEQAAISAVTNRMVEERNVRISQGHDHLLADVRLTVDEGYGALKTTPKLNSNDSV